MESQTGFMKVRSFSNILNFLFKFNYALYYNIELQNYPFFAIFDIGLSRQNIVLFSLSFYQIYDHKNAKNNVFACNIYWLHCSNISWNKKLVRVLLTVLRPRVWHVFIFLWHLSMKFCFVHFFCFYTSNLVENIR